MRCAGSLQSRDRRRVRPFRKRSSLAYGRRWSASTLPGSPHGCDGTARQHAHGAVVVVQNVKLEDRKGHGTVLPPGMVVCLLHVWRKKIDVKTSNTLPYTLPNCTYSGRFCPAGATAGSNPHCDQQRATGSSLTSVGGGPISELPRPATGKLSCKSRT